eukprot:scaffold1218_cov117-Isochrysis_galbana.AAC.1
MFPRSMNSNSWERGSVTRDGLLALVMKDHFSVVSAVTCTYTYYLRMSFKASLTKAAHPTSDDEVKLCTVWLFGVQCSECPFF